MSEFTVGTLYLKKDEAAMQAALEGIRSAHLIKNLNEKWNVLKMVKYEPL